jgi:hypothetical protein
MNTYVVILVDGTRLTVTARQWSRDGDVVTFSGKKHAQRPTTVAVFSLRNIAGVIEPDALDAAPSQ